MGLAEPRIVVVQPGAQHLERLVLVFELASFVLTGDDYARGEVRYPYCRFGLVDLLSARARRAVDIYPYILVAYFHVDVFGFGQHGDGDRGGVYAPLRFGFGHALYAVHAAFELEAAVCAPARDVEHDFLYAAQLGIVFIHFLYPEAVALAVVDVHSVQLVGEQRRLLAAGACAYLHYAVALVVLVLGQQDYLYILFQLFELRPARVRLVGEQLAHFGVGFGFKLLFCLLGAAGNGHILGILLGGFGELRLLLGEF